MTRAREPWNIRPARKPAALSDPIKREVETKVKKLIDEVLKPRYVVPPEIDQQSNYITDIKFKWYRNNFYLILIYACPNPKAISPGFEWKFARIEPLGGGRFALYAMRYTGKEWIGVADSLTVDECMKAIRDDPWFVL
jgi:hypothetical protein